jgi:hypothetical protein
VKKVFVRLWAGAFTSWIGCVAAINVISFFLYPGLSPIHDLIAPWDTLWAVTYGLAGILIFIGIGWERGNAEAAGIILLIGGALVQVLVFSAAGSVRSLTGTWFTVTNLSLLAIFASGRLWELLKASKFLIEDERFNGQPDEDGEA